MNNFLASLWIKKSTKTIKLMMKGDGRINLNKFSKKRSITNINIIDIINICYIFRESFGFIY